MFSGRREYYSYVMCALDLWRLLEPKLMVTSLWGADLEITPHVVSVLPEMPRELPAALLALTAPSLSFTLSGQLQEGLTLLVLGRPLWAPRPWITTALSSPSVA